MFAFLTMPVSFARYRCQTMAIRCCSAIWKSSVFIRIYMLPGKTQTVGLTSKVLMIFIIFMKSALFTLMLFFYWIFYYYFRAWKQWRISILNWYQCCMAYVQIESILICGWSTMGKTVLRAEDSEWVNIENISIYIYMIIIDIISCATNDIPKVKDDVYEPEYLLFYYYI